MDTKPILKMKKKVSDKSMKYANDQSTDMSKLIENNLSAITKETSSEVEVSPEIKSLSGVIKLPMSKVINHEKFYQKHIAKKYL